MLLFNRLPHLNRPFSLNLALYTQLVLCYKQGRTEKLKWGEKFSGWRVWHVDLYSPCRKVLGNTTILLTFIVHSLVTRGPWPKLNMALLQDSPMSMYMWYPEKVVFQLVDLTTGLGALWHFSNFLFGIISITDPFPHSVTYSLLTSSATPVAWHRIANAV